ncbi:glycosyltransferase [Miltoncostaea marina]|uniref:glycosyltransferase n=1 Tax=Miltoncostaea marina TaxID=2843215 RepID=UPI001C3D10A2|nr:glycosyltransferase [Miltoncostaea marina]
MRILTVAPYPPSRDGIGDYAAALTGAMSAAGHEVRVVTPRFATAAPAEVIGALAGPREGGDVALRRVAAFAPDVVHVQFAVAAFGTGVPALLRFIAEVRAATGAPVVVTAHEVTRDTAMLRLPGRLLYRRLCAGAARVLVHTGAAARALVDEVGVDAARVAVVPHHRRPPPEPAVAPGELRARHGLGDARVLLAFGFVHVDKGLDDLVAALAALRARRPDALTGVRLVVAGTVRPRSGAFRAFEARDRLHLARVRRAIAREGMGELVRFTGYVPEGEVAPWFGLAEALVLPYRRIEQSGVGSLAAALGVPVVASRAGGLAEDFGDPRWTHEPGDREGLAAAIERLLARSPAEAAGRPPRRAAGAGLDEVARSILASYHAVTSAPTREPHAQPA